MKVPLQMNSAKVDWICFCRVSPFTPAPVLRKVLVIKLDVKVPDCGEDHPSPNYSCSLLGGTPGFSVTR